MTSHQSRRTALTLTALLLAGMTLGAPVALAATPSHTPPRHSAWQNELTRGTTGATAPHFPVVESHVDDSFAPLHQE
jgi:hypothetical protein